MKQPFCTPAQALRRVLDAAAALPVPATERVPLDDACGRIAARDLCARMDQPPFDRSPLDGYALHSADTAGAGEKTPVTLPVVMKLYAGDAPAAALPAGCAARIMTGAPLPPGADCVLMQELTDGGEEQVRIYARLQPNVNVVFRGEDIAAGAPIAAAGTVLTPAHIGVLAGQGIPDAEVFRPLTVGVLATGSELLEAGEAWAPGKIYDANGIQNAARLRQLGFAVERTHCSDDPEEIAARMNVSKPSAHSMLQNLCQAGLVEKERYGTVYLTREGRSAAAGYAACFGPLCRRMQEALGLEEDACQTAACAILAQSQDRLPQLRDRLRAAE